MTSIPSLDLAIQLQNSGRLAEAATLYEQILDVQQNNGNARHLLGLVYLGMGYPEAAIIQLQQAITLMPKVPFFHRSLGLAEQSLSHHEAAIEAFTKAIKRKPDFAEAYFNLGSSMMQVGRYDEAIKNYKRAVALQPKFVAAQAALGDVNVVSGRLSEAIAAYRRALELDSKQVNVWLNLGATYNSQQEFEEAVKCYTQALALDPNDADAHNNLANVLSDQGKTAIAIKHYQRAIELKADFLEADSNLLLSLNCSPDVTPEEVFEAHLAFARKYEAPLQKDLSGKKYDVECKEEKRLRIGYVSPDFRNHPVSYFFEPVLRHHDRGNFEIYCYSNHLKEDEVTERLSRMSDCWRNIAQMSDEQVADQIRGDRVDILVDLAGHTANNRVLTFARKPAPIQMTWLGYLCTTGLAAMDYRLTDAYADPIDKPTYHSEQCLRMPHSQWCYEARIDTPAVGPLPASTNGYVTFGSFNNLAKVSDAVINLWAMLLRRVPNSRLFVMPVAEGGARTDLAEKLTNHGISPDRITLCGRLSIMEYLETFNQVDIALDTFPYNGGTTTCDALWMGVPVVALAGTRSIARGGLSLLSTIGLPELAGQTPEEYVEIAQRLSQDISKLAQLRSELRERMSNSPLMAPAEFTKSLEAHMRESWKQWCCQMSAVK